MVLYHLRSRRQMPLETLLLPTKSCKFTFIYLNIFLKYLSESKMFILSVILFPNQPSLQSWACTCRCVCQSWCLTSEERSVYQSGGLQDDDGQVRVQLPGRIISAHGEEDWRASSSDHWDPANLQRGQLSFRLTGNTGKQ